MKCPLALAYCTQKVSLGDRQEACQQHPHEPQPKKAFKDLFIGAYRQL